MSLLDLLNTKKITWQKKGKRRVQLNIPKVIMGGLISEMLAKLSNMHERKIGESLEINNLETKRQIHQSVK